MEYGEVVGEKLGLVECRSAIVEQSRKFKAVEVFLIAVGVGHMKPGCAKRVDNSDVWPATESLGHGGDADGDAVSDARSVARWPLPSCGWMARRELRMGWREGEEEEV